MSALETIQPNSFALLDLKINDGLGDHLNVILKYQRFAEINYYAFVCLTTLGLGDIKPILPAARMITVVTSIVGPMYMVVLMGVLIGRLSGHSKEITRGSSERSEFSSDK
ncbi:MAG: potassium channel family protein [Prochlorococcaceae cyanobacterium ETNP18_MAG_1]|nr:potassium channel family protein [Prochlorococcaceae cyanobacterium ETNP18_MAG_1]